MSKILCRKCPECELYYDISHLTCPECETDLHTIAPEVLEEEQLTFGNRGECDPAIKVYVQKCPVCGAAYYTTDSERCTTLCDRCHKTRIADVEPTEYFLDKSEECKQEPDDVQKCQVNIPPTPPEHTLKTIDEEDEITPDALNWLNRLRSNIGTAVETFETEKGSEKDNKKNNQYVATPQKGIKESPVDEDSDDDELVTWENFGVKSHPEKETINTAQKPSIMLSALSYGYLSFTVDPEQGSSYLLGRSANQKEFLSQDARISNEHCYLLLKGGQWFVRDNHSSNGTAVNGKDIGENGERPLYDGDKITLGHHPDSMTFSITIK